MESLELGLGHDKVDWHIKARLKLFRSLSEVPNGFAVLASPIYLLLPIIPQDSKIAQHLTPEMGVPPKSSKITPF